MSLISQLQNYSSNSRRSSHIMDIANASPDFRNKVRSIVYLSECHRSRLTDAAVIALVKSCPNLREVEFRDADKLSDAVLSAILYNCRKIRSITMTESLIKCEALRELRKDLTLAKKLKHLDIRDRGGSQSARFRSLSVSVRNWRSLKADQYGEVERSSTHSLQKFPILTVMMITSFLIINFVARQTGIPMIGPSMRGTPKGTFR